MQTLPYIAEVVQLAGGELRIVDRERGREILQTYRTRDGRQATPTFVLLDADARPLGCWIERPKGLAAVPFLTQQAPSESAGLAAFRLKREWYLADSGRGTVDEFLALLEAGAEGQSWCNGVVAPPPE